MVTYDILRIFLRLIIRVVLSIPTILSVITIGFILLKLAPGDPAVLLAGEAATPQYIERIRELYGLNKPLFEQYIIYLNRALTFDLGYSLSYKRAVLDVILSRLPYTILLAVSGLTLGISIGIILGIISAWYRRRLISPLISNLAFILYSTPVFVIGQFLIYYLAIIYKTFPVGGVVTVGTLHENTLFYIADVLWHLALPSLTLGLVFMASYVKLTKSSFQEVLSSNYILTSRSMGLRNYTILFKHAFRNAIIPVVTLAGVQLGLLIGGVIITESIFSWPGIGQLTMDAISTRDYPLLLGIFIFTSVAVILINIVVDSLYTIIDPRIRERW
ncbi:MAG: ABC transporter permease [Sulfolobales archaeon]|nr:ABC transporter permease [Sulfolobales archaeon]